MVFVVPIRANWAHDGVRDPAHGRERTSFRNGPNLATGHFGSMAAPPNEGLGLLGEHIAAVLEHNGMTADEAFPFFDLDQDERLSVADLLESCAQANVNSSQPQVAAWIAHHARQDDKSFLTLSDWRAALAHADGSRVLQACNPSVLSARLIPGRFVCACCMRCQFCKPFAGC